MPAMPLVRIPAPYRGPTRGAARVEVHGGDIRGNTTPRAELLQQDYGAGLEQGDQFIEDRVEALPRLRVSGLDFGRVAPGLDQ